MMDRETRINKKPANIKNQRVKLEESYAPSLEDEGMRIQNLFADSKMDHLPVDDAFCFDMLDSCGAQGQEGLGFGVLDSILDGVDEVDDIYAANDISGAYEDFILDNGMMEKATFLDGVLCDGTRLSNSSSESQSPRLCGSSNGVLVPSESSTVTITESECLNVCNEKRVNCEFNDPSRVKSEFTGLEDQNTCTNSHAFINRTDCDDGLKPSKRRISSERYEKKPVQLIRGVAITREKRMLKPTKRYIEEFSNCKPKQSLEAGKVLSVALKDKCSMIMWQNEHNRAGAWTLSSDEFHANNGTDDEPEDIKELSDKKLRRAVSRQKILSAASKDKQLKDESHTLTSDEFHANNVTDDESEDVKELLDKKIRFTVSRRKIAASKDKQLKDESLNGLLSQDPSESRPRRGRPKKNSPYLILKYDEHSSSESEDTCVKRKKSKKKGDRRKHQRMWTLAEVMKLIDGIAQYGTGRWTDIKKLLFSSSGYRTPVDLRDKWRNLLRASCAEKQKQNEKEAEQKLKHVMRPLPKAVLCRIRELASLHPYPRFMPGGRYTRSKN